MICNYQLTKLIIKLINIIQKLLHTNFININFIVKK